MAEAVQVAVRKSVDGVCSLGDNDRDDVLCEWTDERVNEYLEPKRGAVIDALCPRCVRAQWVRAATRESSPPPAQPSRLMARERRARRRRARLSARPARRLPNMSARLGTASLWARRVLVCSASLG